jgi:hypothetical protein
MWHIEIPIIGVNFKDKSMLQGMSKAIKMIDKFIEYGA